jgi:hypothetical protein
MWVYLSYGYNTTITTVCYVYRQAGNKKQNSSSKNVKNRQNATFFNEKVPAVF